MVVDFCRRVGEEETGKIIKSVKSVITGICCLITLLKLAENVILAEQVEFLVCGESASVV